MTKPKTMIDRLIEPAIIRAAKRPGYFHKSQVVNEVLNSSKLGGMLVDIEKRYSGWDLDEIIRRYITGRVGSVLQQRDSNGIRVYECYSASESERRWMPIRGMTVNHLRAVMQETRTQARHLEVKAAGYQMMIKELEKLSDTAIVDQVYDKVVPLIKEARSA